MQKNDAASQSIQSTTAPAAHQLVETKIKLVSDKSKVSRRNHCRSDPVRVQSTNRETGNAHNIQLTCIAPVHVSKYGARDRSYTNRMQHRPVAATTTFVTPEGVLRPAMRNARATRVGT